MEARYLSVKDFAIYTGMNLGSVRNRIAYNPDSLPPFIVIFGSERRTIRFDRMDVDKWMADRKTNASTRLNA